MPTSSGGYGEFNLQPILKNETVILQPLSENDFDELYAVASDPEIWEQHPSKERWKRPVFQTYYEGAMQSGGALKIIDVKSGMVLGSSRFYDYNNEEDSVLVGYTFIAKACWGKGINRQVKELMLDHAFLYVSKVLFHVGAGNIRSRIAVERLGAKKIAETVIAYHGEVPRINCVYEMRREDWQRLQKSHS